MGGYLISFDNLQAFNESVLKLIDVKKRKQMGIFNRNKVISKYSLEARVKREIDIYEEILT